MSANTTRRNFLMGSAALAGLDLAGRADSTAAGPARSYELKLGIASYSLREFSRNLALKMIKELGTPYVNFKDVHLPYEISDEDFQRFRKRIQEAGIIITGGGTISMKKDDDASIRRHFEYARKWGLPMMVIAPTRQTLPRIEKFVKEYNTRVAVHNHGPEDKHFPSPYDVLEVIQQMDSRMGLCADLGHALRTGTDVVKALADAGSRLFDVHIKDLRDPKQKDSQCDVGEGVMPVPAIFRQLLKMRFAGNVALEYEINEFAPLEGMKKSLAYMRGVLDGLKA